MAEFTDIKTLTTATAAEAAPAAIDTAFVTVAGLTKNNRLSRLVELRLKNDSVGGTVAPTSVSFDLWRLIDGVRDFIGTWVVNGADITADKVPPVIYETWGNQVMVTLSALNGGTAPTVTATVQARPVE